MSGRIQIVVFTSMYVTSMYTCIYIYIYRYVNAFRVPEEHRSSS